jgi:hypothetical protein
MIKRAALLTIVALFACAAPVLAWGPKGHTIVNRLAAQALADQNVPSFLKTASAQFEIAYLGPEEDRLKGSGRSWDADYDPGHYLDLMDDATVAGVVSMNDLPPSQAAYDEALRAANTDSHRQGYLPYSILDGWEELRDDFAYWRVDKGEVKQIDEQLVLRDLGVWGHFVGDACQPLHVTVHFNGWGKYPNPNGYTQSRRTHAFFESEFVNRYVTQARVAALVPHAVHLQAGAQPASQKQVLSEIVRYLLETSRTVPQLYQIEKTGGFANGSPQATRFTASRLATGTAELRDLVLWAYEDSLNAKVGYPAVSLRDILAGKARWRAGNDM